MNILKKGNTLKLICESPFVEYFFTKPAWRKIFSFINKKGSTSAVNPYGHASIRYCIPNKLDVMMNVSGVKNDKLVNFFDSDKFLFTNSLEQGNEQGGIINRSFISIRINNICETKITQLHNYYQNLQDMNTKNIIGYDMILYMITNKFKFMNMIEKGNCTYWTSKGMLEINLIEKVSNWPLMLWFRLLYERSKLDFDNTDIIAYRSIKYKKEPTGAFVHPFFGFFRSNAYETIWDLDSFANIIVEPKKSKNLENIFELDIKETIHIRKRWNDIKDKFKNIFRFK